MIAEPARSVEPGRRATSSLRWLPFLTLAVSAAVLLARWDSLPARWIVHWGAGGRADGWASRTISGVFAPLLMGSLVCLLLEAIATGSTLLHPGVGEGASRSSSVALARLTADLVRTLNVGLALVFSLIAVGLPMLQPSSPGAIVITVLGLISGALLMGMARMARAYRVGVARGEIEAMKGYNGLVYRNPDDPRLWVPKQSGLGSTINFAHPRAWLMLAALLAGPAIAVFVLLLLT